MTYRSRDKGVKKEMGRNRLKQEVLLKCTKDFLLIRYGRMTLSETMALKEELLLRVPKRVGACHTSQGHMAKYQGQSGDRRC